MDNKSFFHDNNVKLPKLYTNSSKMFGIGEIKDKKFLEEIEVQLIVILSKI